MSAAGLKNLNEDENEKLRELDNLLEEEFKLFLADIDRDSSRADSDAQ